MANKIIRYEIDLPDQTAQTIALEDIDETSGQVWQVEECPECEGAGVRDIVDVQYYDGDYLSHEETCYKCNGTGEYRYQY